MSDFQLECAESLIEDYYGELTLEEAQRVVTKFGGTEFWQNYLKMKKAVIDEVKRRI